ncbi:hypothetical protein GN244_ATG12036 [Phytophthora infestans]|uniref:Uncharacterized protein n=1 Tax=Phytophthora infestans TaxID=4787 RepID=A0A833RZ62_PHYIN|nr:hypothetical protein GN244_ATG12036 [Phytophthora infestans]KAF4133235.1 hypothetical protein GN958_ATG17581 [Phytophthora infestans]
MWTPPKLLATVTAQGLSHKSEDESITWVCLCCWLARLVHPPWSPADGPEARAASRRQMPHPIPHDYALERKSVDHRI